MAISSCSSCGEDAATKFSQQLYAERSELNRVQEAASDGLNLAEMQAEQLRNERLTFRDPESVAQVVDISI